MNSGVYLFSQRTFVFVTVLAVLQVAPSKFMTRSCLCWPLYRPFVNGRNCFADVLLLVYADRRLPGFPCRQFCVVVKCLLM